VTIGGLDRPSAFFLRKSATFSFIRTDGRAQVPFCPKNGQHVPHPKAILRFPEAIGRFLIADGRCSRTD
jgi:hypothetical protein